MFFVDAICQQYFVLIFRKFQHFLSQKQSFMFSFMQNNQNFIIREHSNMVDIMLHAWRNFWLLLIWGQIEDNIEIPRYS